MNFKKAYLSYKFNTLIIRSIGIFVAILVIFAIFGQVNFGIIIGLIIAGSMYKNSFDSADEKMWIVLGNIGIQHSTYSSRWSRNFYEMKPFYRYKNSVGYPNYLLKCEFKKNFVQLISKASETKNINKFGEVSITRNPERSYQGEDGVSIIINSPTSITCDIRFVLTPVFAIDRSLVTEYDFAIRYVKRGDSIVRFIKPGQSLEFKFSDCHSGEGRYEYHSAYLCYKVDLQFTEK
ncbi:MAG: hypothetical protein WCP16_20865 [Pseudanabaena sp. ELA645]|jgi:hypothetical protein